MLINKHLMIRGKMAVTVEEKLNEIGIKLPVAAIPVANYVPYIIDNGSLYISGQLPMGADGIAYVGQLGASINVENGRKAAELCAINILAQAKAALGDLDKVAQVIKLVGFVNSTAEFGEHPAVINGASDLMVNVFEDKGKHSRSAVGVSSLPFQAAVEVEAILRVNV